ncbi:HD domain-containing protein [Primorskyibacter sp. S187A]|uniref:HD domain-containing protein n=1 Tax=Primorskyibacter sp. S187A TaxID=3415130 RepID=UPI003C7EB03A
MAFLQEIDKLKSVSRATRVHGGRQENSAEHSWHLAMYALILSEHAPENVNRDRVIKMLLLHDLVEIDAGDAPIFGDYDAAALAAQEQAAATRLFGLLPSEQGEALRRLWDEFEANETADARFAKSLDRFQPPNQNLATGGGSWVEYNVSFAQLHEKVGRKIAAGAPKLWDWIAPKAKAFLDKL